MVRSFVVILYLMTLCMCVSSEEITLIQGENGYTGFRTDNISNPEHTWFDYDITEIGKAPCFNT